ncbi:MAG TPA: hypothetical protein VIX82_07140, partial [Solirubrobacteraceae bacterium]
MISATAEGQGSARRGAELALPVVGLVVCALTVGVGLAIRHTTGGLGTRLPPFVLRFSPDAHPLALVSVAVLGVGATLAPRWIGRPYRPSTIAGGLFGLTLALGLSLNVARAGVHEWTAVFTPGGHGSPEAAFEYLPGLPALSHGVAYYVGN